MEKGAQNTRCNLKKKRALAESNGKTGMAVFFPKSASMKHIFFAVKFGLNGYLTELWLKKEAPLHGRL